MKEVYVRPNCNLLLENVLKEIFSYADQFGESGVPSVVLKAMIALDYAVQFHPEVSEVYRSKMLREAANSTVKSGQFTQRKFFENLHVLVTKYLSQPKEPFVYVAFIAVDGRKPFKRRRVDGATVTFARRLQGKFLREFDQIRRGRVSPGTTVIPSDYHVVKVLVSARTPYDAYAQASSSFDFIRALWNLQLNRSVSMRFGATGYKRPINRLLTLPFCTIHHPNGDRATNDYWYDFHHLYIYPGERIRSNQVSGMYEFEIQARRKIKKCAYRDTIKSALLRYVRALDEPDYNSAFIKMWSILEALVGVADSKSSLKDFSKQIASLFNEPSYNEIVLESLRLYRNSMIHHEQYSGEVDSLLWATKLYVEVLLVFHIDYGAQFSSINEAMEFVKARSNLEKTESEVRRLSKFVALAKKL